MNPKTIKVPNLEISVLKSRTLSEFSHITLIDGLSHIEKAGFYCLDHCKNSNKETLTCSAYCEFAYLFLKQVYAQKNPFINASPMRPPNTGYTFTNYSTERIPNSTEEIFNKVKQDFTR